MKPGVNNIERMSTDSGLIINPDTVYGKQEQGASTERSNQCRCGWPVTLLIPRGTESGMKFKLFAMVSDYEKEKVIIEPAENNLSYN